MPALRVIISRQAANDLDEIWDYVANAANSNIASDLIEEILEAISNLAEMPGMGHTRRDISKRFRVWRVFKFLIIYRFDSRAIYVSRVVHGHRDIRRIVLQ